MADHKTALAVGAAVAIFACGAVVAAHMPDAEPATSSVADPSWWTAGIDDDRYSTDWHRQTALAAYQSRLLRYAQQADGFTGARFAFGRGAFILYGKGPPPAIVRGLIAMAPAAANARWVRVPYSLAELDEARRRLARAMPPNSVVDYAPNYSGILVGLRPLPTPHGQEILYGRAQRLTEVPVTFLQVGFANPM
jgi:hypothetical protein